MSEAPSEAVATETANSVLQNSLRNHATRERNQLEPRIDNRRIEECSIKYD